MSKYQSIRDVIEMPNMDGNSLCVKYDSGESSIINKAKLIVRETQLAQFIYLGQFGDLFEPGLHVLKTDNIPLLTSLKNWQYGFESPFKADVFFISTKLFSACKWGTTNPVLINDPSLGMIRVRSFGTYSFRVANTRQFIKMAVGTDHDFTLQELEPSLKTKIATTIAETLAICGLSITTLNSQLHKFSLAIQDLLNKTVGEMFGIEIVDFVVESITLPQELERNIDAKASIDIIGDLDSYLKVKLLDSIGGNNTLPFFASGAIGAHFASIMSGGFNTPPKEHASHNNSDIKVYSLNEACDLLKVSESGILNAIESGELKARQIGKETIITDSAIRDFLNSEKKQKQLT